MKYIYIVLGCISLVLGAIGAVVPLMPSFVFLLFAGFCFARSSQELNDWFKSTNLYKNNLESYVQKRSMSLKVKIKIMSMVSAAMAIGFIMMKNVPVGRLILFIVWIFHIGYFIFAVKTESKKPVKLSTKEVNELS